jgi:hypothetical protein
VVLLPMLPHDWDQWESKPTYTHKWDLLGPIHWSSKSTCRPMSAKIHR